MAPPRDATKHGKRKPPTLQIRMRRLPFQILCEESGDVWQIRGGSLQRRSPTCTSERSCTQSEPASTSDQKDGRENNLKALSIAEVCPCNSADAGIRART